MQQLWLIYNQVKGNSFSLDNNQLEHQEEMPKALINQEIKKNRKLKEVSIISNEL